MHDNTMVATNKPAGTLVHIMIWFDLIYCFMDILTKGNVIKAHYSALCERRMLDGDFGVFV